MRIVESARTGPKRTELSNTIKTLVSTLTLLVLWSILISHITDGFRYWTFESIRALNARELKLVAPTSHFLTSTGTESTLWAGSNPRTIYVVDFIYTSCPTICQILGSSSEQMQSEIAEQNDESSQIRLLSISIDIDRDNPTRLRSYASRFNADPRYWSVVAPRDRAGLADLLANLEVVAIPDGSGGFVHNGDLQVIDGAGRVRGLFDSADWRRALALSRLLVGAT